MFCSALTADSISHESGLVEDMGRQPRIDPKILVDWLVEAAHKFELMSSSFYLIIYTIDRFLDGSCSSSGLQRVSLTASKRRSRCPWSMVSFTSQPSCTHGSRER